MIKGCCVTNLDGYAVEKWPSEFAAVPRVGEWVEAESGKVLTVVKVTHRMGHTATGHRGPVIKVELHR